MTHDRMQKPAPRREVVSWSSACDWAPIAALLGRDVAALRAEVAALPDGIEGVALLRDGVPAAVAERAGEHEVETIAVASRARGRGLGRWLLRRCEALLDGAGAREVVLRVAASNAPALALYRAEA